MAKIANVALTDTFNTWRTRSNQTFDRVSQFAINNSSLYANTLTSNTSFTSKGLATLQGRATVGTNLTVSGNTTLGAAGKTMTTTGIWSHTGALSATNLTISGNTTLGGTGKTIGLTGALTHTGTANVSGWFGVTGRQSISTNLFVGANTFVMNRLGVGTLTPSYPLVIAASQNSALVSQIINTSVGASAQGILQVQVGASAYVNYATSPTYNQIIGTGAITTQYIDFDNQVFRTNAGVEVARFTNGGLKVTANTSVSGRLGIGLASSSVDQALHTYWTAASATYAHIQHSGAYNSGIQFQNSQGNWYSYILGGSNQYEILGGSAATAKLTISAAGTVTVPLNLTVTNTLSAGNTVLTGTTTDRSNALSQTLTDGATITWDTSLGRVATLTLGAAGRTMAAPTNLKVGTYILRVYQDATGSRTITTWNSVFKWTAAVAPVLSTGAGKLDIITFFSDGTNLYGSYLPDMR